MSEERARARLRRLVRRVTYNQEEEEERNPEGAAKASDKVGLKPITMLSFLISFDPSGAA